MKVLLVEDERDLADVILRELRSEGFAVDHCATGTSALEALEDSTYNAVVLDIMLPGPDGISILRRLRGGANTVPVIIISARDAPEERIEGLNLGADDYLPKPFYLNELTARLRAVWRRTAGAGLSVVQVGDLRINLLTREIRRGETSIELTPREFDLLVFLAQRPGRVWSRTQILDHVWEYHFQPGTNLVDVCMRRLRNKVDLPGLTAMLETVRGVGYRMKPCEP